MKALEVVLVGYAIVGLASFSVWCMYVFVKSELPAGSDVTSQVIWHTGRGLVWLAVSVLVAGLFGTAARVGFDLINRG